MHPNIFNNCGKKHNDNMQNNIAIITTNRIPFATPLAASCFFFSPNFKLRKAEDPLSCVAEGTGMMLEKLYYIDK